MITDGRKHPFCIKITFLCNVNKMIMAWRKFSDFSSNTNFEPLKLGMGDLAWWNPKVLKCFIERRYELPGLYNAIGT